MRFQRTRRSGGRGVLKNAPSPETFRILGGCLDRRDSASLTGMLKKFLVEKFGASLAVGIHRVNKDRSAFPSWKMQVTVDRDNRQRSTATRKTRNHFLFFIGSLSAGAACPNPLRLCSHPVKVRPALPNVRSCTAPARQGNGNCRKYSAGIAPRRAPACLSVIGSQCPHCGREDSNQSYSLKKVPRSSPPESPFMKQRPHIL